MRATRPLLYEQNTGPLTVAPIVTGEWPFPCEVRHLGELKTRACPKATSLKHLHAFPQPNICHSGEERSAAAAARACSIRISSQAALHLHCSRYLPLARACACTQGGCMPALGPIRVVRRARRQESEPISLIGTKTRSSKLRGM